MGLMRTSAVPPVVITAAHGSRLHTDESSLYGGMDAFFAAREMVKHRAGEYVRGDIYTNLAEGCFSFFESRHVECLSAPQRETPASVVGGI
jgi:hypothetical protein